MLLYVCMYVCVLCDIVDCCNSWNSNMFEKVFRYQSEMFHHISDILGLKNQKSDNFAKFAYNGWVPIEGLQYYKSKWSRHVIVEIPTCLKWSLTLFPMGRPYAPLKYRAKNLKIGAGRRPALLWLLLWFSFARFLKNWLICMPREKVWAFLSDVVGKWVGTATQ